MKAIALEIMFGGKVDLAKHGLEYRKGKTKEHIENALRKASKNGLGKTEFEISMFEVYLKDVLKKASE